MQNTICNQVLKLELPLGKVYALVTPPAYNLMLVNPLLIIDNATAAEVNPPVPLFELPTWQTFKATSARMAREEARAKYVTKKKRELTITPNTMLQGLHRYGLHEFCGPAPPLIDQTTFIEMACEELGKMKKKTHKPQIMRPTPITPSTKPQSCPSLAGDDTY